MQLRVESGGKKNQKETFEGINKTEVVRIVSRIVIDAVKSGEDFKNISTNENFIGQSFSFIINEFGKIGVSISENTLFSMMRNILGVLNSGNVLLSKYSFKNELHIRKLVSDSIPTDPPVIEDNDSKQKESQSNVDDTNIEEKNDDVDMGELFIGSLINKTVKDLSKLSKSDLAGADIDQKIISILNINLPKGKEIDSATKVLLVERIKDMVQNIILSKNESLEAKEQRKKRIIDRSLKDLRNNYLTGKYVGITKEKFLTEIGLVTLRKVSEEDYLFSNEEYLDLMIHVMGEWASLGLSEENKSSKDLVALEESIAQVEKSVVKRDEKQIVSQTMEKKIYSLIHIENINISFKKMFGIDITMDLGLDKLVKLFVEFGINLAKKTLRLDKDGNFVRGNGEIES